MNWAFMCKGRLDGVTMVGLIFILAVLGFTPVLHAQNYPSKPIRLVVGFPPGGSNDLVARLLAPKLSEFLGVQVVVENRAGANATIGTEYVSKAPADGYVITLGSTSALVISPHTYAKLGYDTLKDFSAITTVAMTPEALAVHPSLPAQDLKSLLALAKKNPGAIDIASSGNGGLPHLAIELLKSMGKINVQHIAFKGAGPALTDLLGGHVQGMMIDFPVIYPHMKSGKLRGLALTAEKRLALMPLLPTTVEQGLPDLIAVNWFGVLAPAKTPALVTSKLHGSLVKVASHIEMKDKWMGLGIETFTLDSPQVFTTFLQEELIRWGKVALASGAKSD